MSEANGGGGKRVRLKGTPSARTNAKRLRRTLSLPEVLLWQVLRRHATHRFRRQHPAGPYSLDFYCAPARLAIEVDGENHARGDRPERDVVRDAWLAAQGVRTLRVAAKDVLRDLDAVVRLIEVALAEPPSPSTIR